MFYVDVGTIRLGKLPIYQNHPLEDVNVVGGDTKEKFHLHAIERNMTRLTLSIPMVEIEDVPRHLQHHVVNVPLPLVRPFY